MTAKTIAIGIAVGVIALIAIGALALQYAIARNGPAVLTTVDRITGGTNGAELKATISTGAHPQQKLLVWGPEDRDAGDAPLPVLLFIHGGSWRDGDPVDYAFMARSLVQEGILVVFGGYRLGADGVYPAMLEDTARAVEWTREEIAGFGGDPDRIILAGHSAGAYNAMMVALEEQWLGRRGMAADDLAGVIGLAGPYDFLPLDSDSTKASFGHVENLPKTQPVSHIRGDAPPMLLIHGEADETVNIRHTNTLAKMVSEAGGTVSAHRYPGMGHGDPIIALASPWRNRDSHRDIHTRIVAFIRSSGASFAQTSVPVKPEAR